MGENITILYELTGPEWIFTLKVIGVCLLIIIVVGYIVYKKNEKIR